MFSVEPKVQRGYDQETLSTVAWPAMKESAAIYDSYHCTKLMLGSTRPWPTKAGTISYK